MGSPSRSKLLVIKITRPITAGGISRTPLNPPRQGGPQPDVRELFAPALTQSAAVSPDILPKQYPRRPSDGAGHQSQEPTKTAPAERHSLCMIVGLDRTRSTVMRWISFRWPGSRAQALVDSSALHARCRCGAPVRRNGAPGGKRSMPW